MLTQKELQRILMMVGVLVFCSPVFARSIPNLIDFQGRLADSDGVPLDTTVAITFAVYDDSTGGVALWSENQNPVYVQSGLFHVLLGSVTAIPDTLFQEAERWIGINVNADGEMTPRSRIGSVPYAFQAGACEPDTDWEYDGDDIYHQTGDVSIGTATSEFKLTLAADGGIIAKGQYFSGRSLTTSGAGTRLIWYPYKAAFRAGYVDGDSWDDANIGFNSIATGYETLASGMYSTAFGYNCEAGGYISTAAGDGSTASSGWSVAIGCNANADADYAIAIGHSSTANAANAIALGYNNTASESYAFALGRSTIASGESSTAMGYQTEASALYATAMGEGTTASGAYASALGKDTEASGFHSLAAGRNVTTSGETSIALGYNLTAGPAANTIVFGKGLGNDPLRLVNNTANSMMVGFNTTTPTLFVGGADHRVGIGTATPARALHINDVIRLEPRNTAPANPLEGDIYMDSNDHKLKVYDGNDWQPCW